MVATLNPRKSPRQARSQATVSAILDATARVLVERGYAATNTNLVAERAGVSVGSLYQYFPNKDSLVAALHERHARQMILISETVLRHSAGLSFDESLAEVIRAVVDAHQVERDLHRVLELQCPGLDRVATYLDTEACIAEHLMAMLERHREVLRVDDLKLATYTLLNAMHALVHAVVLQRPAGVSLEQATQEIVRLARGYLTMPLEPVADRRR